MKTISPSDLQEQLKSSQRLVVVDVRTREEHAAAHIPGTHVFPLSEIRPADVLSLVQSPSEPVYLLCRSGSRARLANERLETGGFQQAVVVDGGLDAWARAGLPLVREKKASSRMFPFGLAAGTAVVAGLLFVLGFRRVFVVAGAVACLSLIFHSGRKSSRSPTILAPEAAR